MNIPGLGEVAGCVVAWRAWNDSPEGLRSVTMKETIWKPGEVMTACCMDDMCGSHERFGTSGIWALKARPDFGTVWGKVALWGEVIEHEKGYRCEHSYPIAFYDWPGLEFAQKYADLFGVEVEKPTYEELWSGVPKYRPADNQFLNMRLMLNIQQSQALLQSRQNAYGSALGALGAGFGSAFGYRQRTV